MAHSERNIDLLEVALGPGIKAGFTTRHGGSSSGSYSTLNLGHHVGDDPHAVTQNRRAVATWAQVPLQFAEQVHGIHAHLVTGGTASSATSPLPTADALIATPASVSDASQGIGLAIMVADCCPILLADSRRGIIAAIHAGRAGLMNGIIAATVTRLRELGATWLQAAIGPTICGACYELPADMVRQVAKVVPPSESTTRWGTPGIDIARGVAWQLEELGIPADTSAQMCTFEDDRFFSYRRTTTCAQSSTTGRFAGIISLTPATG